MKKVILSILAILLFTAVKAQIPYYSGSQSKGKLYTYFSTKFHPGHNDQSVYITAQYGLLNKLDFVTDLSASSSSTYQGFGFRFNLLSKKYLGIGGQTMLAFNIMDRYAFSYNANSIYLNGSIYKGLHWVNNLWWTVNRGSKNTLENWLYLGWTIKRFTPMVGLDNYITDSHGSDLMAGVYYTVKNLNLYLWSSNLTKNFGNCRVVLGIDYKF